MKIKNFKTFENSSSVMYYMGDKFDTSNIINVRSKIIQYNRDEIIEELNKNYTGLIYLYNPDHPIDSYVINALKYHVDRDQLVILSDKKTPMMDINDFPASSLKLLDNDENYYMLYGDVIYKIDNHQKPESTKIRWYKKGKLNLDESIRWFKNGRFTCETTPNIPKLDINFIKEQEFIDFLEENGALEEYVKYVIDDCKKDFYSCWGKNIIGTSLTWNKTKSGYSYWNRLDDMWRSYYINNIDDDDLDEAIR